VTKISKEFQQPSVDNPALLHQFAQTLARRYAEMFPAARGFAVSLKESAVGKIRGWDITILHGSLSGAQITISPNRLTPQLIAINVLDDSRVQQTLTKIAAVLALLITAPFFIAGILRARVAFVLILCVVIFFVLALVLSVILVVICRLLKRFDRYFGEATKQRILAVADQLPLPATLDRSNLPVPPPPPPGPIPAFPGRRGPFGIGR